MDKTWMPVTGGILSIICGALDIIWGIVMLVLGAASGIWYEYFPEMPPVILMVVFFIIGIIILLIGVVALIGGIYALRRKKWGMALAGAIAAFFSGSWILGIAAIVFIALSRKEFE